MSWGIGDLGDLRAFGEWAAAAGDGFALLNPLNAAAPTPPDRGQPLPPHQPALAQPALPARRGRARRRALGADLERIARAGRALNAERTIDRDAVAIIKLDALTRIAEASPPGADFRRWRRAQGRSLERFATFCHARRAARRRLPRLAGEPPPPRQPGGRREPAARRRPGARSTPGCSGCIERQLASAAAALPLMHDLPIGVDPGGADVWADRDLFATDFSVGAPPDLFNTVGQDWAQPPLNPWRLRAARLRTRSSRSSAAGFSARHGPAHRPRHGPVPAVLDPARWQPGRRRLRALPRRRHPRHPRPGERPRRRLVVGEDLGTVEPVVREQMAARDILSYRLLWFEDGPAVAVPGAGDERGHHPRPAHRGRAVERGTTSTRSAPSASPVNEPGTAEMRERLARVAGGARTRRPRSS